MSPAPFGRFRAPGSAPDLGR